MSDQDDFDRLMKQSGVARLGDRRPARQRREDEGAQRRGVEQDGAAEFEAAIASMDGTPDKDGSPDPTRGEGDRVQRLELPRRATLRLDSTLDLHGLNQEEALNRLGLFVRNAVVAGMRRVLVVTGRGHHSRGGVPVLRPAVERWIRTEGVRFVAAFGEAPRRLGGRGALVLDLRQPNR